MASTPSLSSAAWALRLPNVDAAQLGSLRLVDGLEVGQESVFLWLRGRVQNESLNALLRALPASHRYHWEQDDSLRPIGSRLASERFPILSWQPLRSWLQVELPGAQFPGIKPRSVAMRLVPGGEMESPNAALVGLTTWVGWAQSAPELRLKPLRFATAVDGRCLVLGAPLPSVPCCLFVEREGIVIPAGSAWSPAVSATTLRRFFGTPDQDIVLWDEVGVRHLTAELFVAATRANASATAASLADISA